MLFFARASSAITSLYVVTGVNSYYNGVYEEKREPEHHYKKLGEADNWGHKFLFKGRHHINTWFLGTGSTLSTARAYFRAPAVEGRPPADQWGFVVDGSREGREKGNPKPEVKVVGVETKIETELETNNCFTPEPILKSISLAILVLTVINI